MDGNVRRWEGLIGGGSRGENEGRGFTDRTSHRRPSVAVCFFVLSSLRTRDWRVSDSAGAASWRSRTFLLSNQSVNQSEKFSLDFRRVRGAERDLDVANHVVLDRREGH